jgi:hypothetical protein
MEIETAGILVALLGLAILLLVIAIGLKDVIFG